ncbi:MAG TPA: lytic transglycosylase domain-containing protein, partial [Stellaceae bacterium]|nr:lytic transglycosylase domain-containing protein [Stellaceae bacterium]
MPPIVCGTLSIVLIILTLGLPASAAETLPAANLDVMRAALAAAQSGDWTRAYAGASTITDPLPLKMLHWLEYARPGAPGRFPDISEFIEQNPNWPAQKSLRKHAEEALAGESDAVAADWFKRHPPVSPTGKLREAEIMMNSGDLEGGAAALRALWIAADFGPLDEKNFLARHASSLRPEDYVQRIDRLLWDGQTEAAHRMLALVPPNYRLLAEARLALAAQAAKAEAFVARVPPQLRSDPGLVFEQLRWHRKKDMTEAAVEILLAQPNDLVRPGAWWAERQAIARRVLASGNAELAYRIVEQHGLIEGSAFSEAQFLLGYIALRYMKQPALAFEQFSRILTRVDTPYAKARAGYWGGRAAEAEGKSELAAKWYAAGADHMATFYGQLAAHQLGHDAPPRPTPEPVPDAAELAQFDGDDVVRAAWIFFDLGAGGHGKIFLLHLADQAKTPAKF